MNNYILATIKPWNIKMYHEKIKKIPGNWFLIDNPELLNIDYIKKINPKLIFFPHWSWKVSEEIINNFECICFHMTDLPYGKGGSPLQNLIVRSHKETVVSALKMESEYDSGPIYFKEKLKLEGSAHQIFKKFSIITFKLIKKIVDKKPIPIKQYGVSTFFDRRKKEESLIPSNTSLEQIYDHIRMLDAPTYPKAFIRWGSKIIEFENAEIIDNKINAKVCIYEEKK